jgi:6-phosphogluconolactonase
VKEDRARPDPSPAARGADFRILSDPGAVARAALDQITAAVSAAERRGAHFSLVLAGGNTPRRLHELLAAEPDLPWERIRLFFGDERCVPPDDPDSNYRMAEETLISKVKIPAENVFRIRGEEDPAQEARRYEQLLRELAQGADRPDFDLVLLGMGADGHTASLFPAQRGAQPALDEPSRWVLPAIAPETVTPRQRITLTAQALTRARRLLFLVTGASKRDVLLAMRQRRAWATERFPAARVGLRANASWFVDLDAGL